MSGEGLLLTTSFWACFAVWAVVDRAVSPSLGARTGAVLTTGVSWLFLLAFTGIALEALVGLAAALLLVYAAAGSFVAGGRAAAGFGALLGLVLGVWSLGKVGSSLDLGPLSWLFVLGGSFLVVKVWTFLKDLRDGRLPDRDPFVFLAYCFYFPCFISGPLHYYGEFRDALAARAPFTGRSFVDNGFRILHGLVKVLVIALVLRPFSLEPLQEVGFSSVGWLDLGVRSIVYSFVLYLDFSGYSDIVIGAGGLLGVRIPENFRLPYLAPNVRDFWQRWHITFTRVLTQYLFVPLGRTLSGTLPAASPRLTATLGYLVTFLFCGFWHGSTLNFLAWGVFHGAGLAVYDAYRAWRMLQARQRREPLRPATGLTRVAVTGLTFSFVSLGWTLFVLPLEFWWR